MQQVKKSIAKRFRIHIKFPFLCLYCDIQDEEGQGKGRLDEGGQRGEGVVEGGGGG